MLAMTLRTFLKSLAFVPLLSQTAQHKPTCRQHLSSCPCNEVVGLHFHYEDSEFIVHQEAEDPDIFQGQLFENHMRNKFWAAPANTAGTLLLVALNHSKCPNGDTDFSRFDLPPNMFYRI